MGTPNLIAGWNLGQAKVPQASSSMEENNRDPQSLLRRVVAGSWISILRSSSKPRSRHTPVKLRSDIAPSSRLIAVSVSRRLASLSPAITVPSPGRHIERNRPRLQDLISSILKIQGLILALLTGCTTILSRAEVYQSPCDGVRA